MPRNLPETTSASQLVTYSMCPRRYALQYIFGFLPDFVSTPLILGSALHSALGWWFEEKIAGRVPSLEKAEDILSADLLAATSGVNVRWKDKTPESLEDEAKRLVRVYLDRFGELNVAAVEQEFLVHLEDPETGEILGRPMRGFLDLVLTNGTIVEIKSAARSWRQSDIVRHLQVGAYAFAYNCLHGGPSQLEVHVIVKLKRAPRVDVFKAIRGEAETRWWLRAAGTIEAAIVAGHYPPVPGFLCAECEHAKACSSWTEELPEVVEHRPAPAGAAHEQRAVVP